MEGVDLTEEELDLISKELFKEDLDFKMCLDLEDMLYSDFDPPELFKTAYKRGLTNGRDRHTVEEDLKKLAVLATFKGCNFWNIFNKSTTEEKEWLLMAKRTYKVKGKPTTRTDFTLRRVAVAHAREISLDLYNGKLKPAVNPETLAPGFPVAMCSSTFWSLLPYNYDEILLEAFCYHQLQFDKLVYLQPQSRFTKDEMKHYVYNKIKSLPYKSQERNDHLLRVNILQKDGENFVINPEIRRALEEAAEKWRSA